MVELLVKQLIEQNSSVPVFFERQVNEPEEFVLIEKIGSSKSNHLESSTFAIQSYAQSLYQAASLNAQTKTIIESMIEHHNIVSIHLNSDYNYTDTETKKYRYQAVYEIKHY